MLVTISREYGAGGSSVAKRVATALAQWIDSDHCPDGAEKMRAEPDRVDWVRVMPFVFLHAGCLGVIWTGASAFAVWTAVALYFIRMFAVTGIHHRYFSHKTYSTSRFGQFLLAGDHVLRGGHRRHGDRKAERADAEDRQRLARRQLEIVENGARAGLDAAAQRTEQLQRRIVRHLDRIDLARQRIGGKRRLREEMVVQRLTLRIGDQRLLARITRYSFDQLGIHAGQTLWAQIKSVALLG